MAIDASQFDPSELPPEAQRLNPDADGNINAEGSLGEKKFTVKHGVIRIIDKDKVEERNPDGEESEEVLNVLSSQVSDKNVKLKPAIIDGKPGIQLDVEGKNVLEFASDVVRNRVKATQEAADTEGTRQTAFSTHWQKTRQDLIGKKDGTLEFLEHIATISTANAAASYLEAQAQKCEGDYDASREVRDDLDEMLGILKGFSTYETELTAAAASEHFDLKTPSLSALSLGDQKGREVLEDRLNTLREKIQKDLEKFEDVDAFVAETGKAFKAEMSEDENKFGRDFCHKLYNKVLSKNGADEYVQDFKTSAIEASWHSSHRIQEVLRELNNAITILEGLISFPSRIEQEASAGGRKLSDSQLKELKGFEPSFGPKMKDKLTELRDQLSARMAFEKDNAAVIDKANAELTPEALGLKDNIENGWSDGRNDYLSDRIQELHGQIDRSAHPEAMARAQEEINEVILPYLVPQLNVATYYRDLYQGLLDKLGANVLEREELEKDLTKRRAQHAAEIAQLSGPVEKAKEILQTVENITGIRSYAKESFEIHKKVPPTRLERIKASLNASAAVGAVRKGVEKVSAERKAAEENTKTVVGECKIPWPSGYTLVFDFKEDGIYQVLADADGNPIERKVKNPVDINRIIDALNEGKARPGRKQKDMFGKPGEHVKFSLDPATGAVIRVDEGAPSSWKDFHRGVRSSVRSAREERRARKTEASEVKKAQKELRSFIKDNKYDTWVAENQKNGLAKEQIVELLYAVLQKDHPEKADKVEEIYSEIIRMKDVRPFVKEHKLGEKVHDLKDPVTGVAASEEIVRAMLEKELPKNMGDEEKEAIIKEAFSAAKWHGRKEGVSDFVSKRKRNLKLLIPFTKEKEWLKWMDEKKIVRSIRKQREDGEKDPAIRAGLETTYKDTEDLKQILDLAFERANDEAANKRLAAAFVKEKKMEEKVRQLIKDGKKEAEIRAALEAEHKATPNMSAAELKEIVDTAIERVEGEKRSTARWETTKKVLKAVTTAAGIGAAGLGVGAGLLGIAGVYGVTKVAQGVMRVGAEVGHQVGDKAPKLAKAVLPTIGGIIKSPFTLIAAPFVGAYRGLSAGWNYPAKPKVRPLKGWTAPFKGIANVFGWGWHKAKAAPSALATGVLGLALGGLWQGPGDAVVHDILGVKTHMPVPAFMTGGGGHGGMPANASVGTVSATPAAANNASHHEEKPHAHAA